MSPRAMLSAMAIALALATAIAFSMAIPEASSAPDYRFEQHV